jgi:ABC-2 type transport system ATP-binding protein
MSGVALEVQDLVVRYGATTAVSGASFAARAGEVTVVLGPNGAGKTTSLESCSGLRAPTAGRVRVLGHDPRRERRRVVGRIGVMLQDGGVYPSARVGETIAHHCALHGHRERPETLVELVGLGAHRDASWRRLSGGERQRLSLALALAARPEVAILDEPTSGVDVEGRDAIRRIVRGLAARGCAVACATHELDEAERLADRVVVFRAGRVVADAPLETMRGGTRGISLETRTPLDAAARDALATRVGAAVVEAGSARVRVASQDAALLAVVARWCDERGATVVDLRLGGASLEDAYRALMDAPHGGDVPRVDGGA